MTRVLCKFDAMLDPKALTPHPDNPNSHTKEQLKRLGKIITSVGWRMPIIVSKKSKFIVKGHGTTQAAIAAGMKEVPVVFQEFKNDDEEYAFLVADNAIAQWSELDLGKINAKLPDLGPDLDLEIFGLQDFGLDPPKVENPTPARTADGVESLNGGGINVIRLFYSPDDYPALLAKANDIMEARECADMSQLFKLLVEEATE